jgi:cyclopropane fatty-acyl-phospholipid synthase-like methyltransferase
VCRDLLDVLRTGRTANWGSVQSAQDWHRSMETPEFADSFTAAMDCRGVFLAQALAKKLDLTRHRHLLDVAGGSGIYSCALAAQNSHLHATVLEKPPVDRIAARAIERRGFSDRVTVIARDMLTAEFPTGADVHLFSNVLHDWGVPDVEKLIAKSAAMLPSGGLFVMHDAFLNEDKTGPLHVAEYSVLLMHSTQGRCYGTAEMRDWLEAAGFYDVRYEDTAAARGVLTALRAG